MNIIISFHVTPRKCFYYSILKRFSFRSAVWALLIFGSTANYSLFLRLYARGLNFFPAPCSLLKCFCFTSGIFLFLVYFHLIFLNFF